MGRMDILFDTSEISHNKKGFMAYWHQTRATHAVSPRVLLQLMMQVVSSERGMPSLDLLYLQESLTTMQQHI